MPNLVNQLLLKEYKTRFEGVQNIVSVGYEGVDMIEQETIRDELAGAGVEFLFVKNRVVNIAFKELGLPEVSSICDGQTAFAFGEDPVAIARMLCDKAKGNPNIKIHGAVVESTILDEAGVKDLSKSPTKEELKAMIVGQVLSPGANIVGATIGPASTIAGQIKARIEELEKSA